MVLSLLRGGRESEWLLNIHLVFRIRELNKNNNKLMKHRMSWDWHSKSQRLSFVCWPTLPVGFDRPFYPKHTKKSPFLWVSLRAPSAAEREGDIFGCADLLGISLSTPFRFATIIWQWCGETSLYPKEFAMRTISTLNFFSSSHYLSVRYRRT